MTRNKHLNVAKKRANDEFYTRVESIDRELKYYESDLRGKTVYCNCDDFRFSNFYIYLKSNFGRYGLKELIASNYSESGEAYITKFDGDKEFVSNLSGTGNYSGEDDEEILSAIHEADVVITNPPFSVFKEFLPFLIKNEKDFIILGSINAVTYVDIFPYIRDGVILPGINFNVAEEFYVPEEYESVVKTKRDEKGRLLSKISNIAWYTTFRQVERRTSSEGIFYNPSIHLNYDNYNAIEVGKVKNIPKDFYGVMGVPVNFLSIYNPNEYEILGSNRGRGQDPSGYFGRSTYLEGKETYKRVFIRRRKETVM